MSSHFASHRETPPADQEAGAAGQNPGVGQKTETSEPVDPAGEPARLCINPSTLRGEVAPVEGMSPQRPSPASRRQRGLMDRVEAFLSRLSTRNNFWHRLCSLIWLPYAFKSGIRMKRIGPTSFSAVLPFRRFNRNWYNAMAGAALLANSEVAGGMYVFGICGGDYEVVCKNLEYRFLRPCFGPAIYRITPREDIQALVAAGTEFNITLDLDVVQQLGKPGSKDKRVGRCVVTFHITPKTHQKTKGRRGDRAAKSA